MSERIKTLLAELRSGLEALYGERLRGLYLYGSYARNDAGAESDVDVLVVLNAIPSYGAEIDRASELMAGLSLEYGSTVSCVFLTEQDWWNLESPFLNTVRDEAIPA